jgi:hypothetical protein
VADEKTPTTSEGEDVEAHLLRDGLTERPDMEASSEEPDVEGHSLDRPGTERPGTE